MKLIYENKIMSEVSEVSSVRWYFWDLKNEKMKCSHCFKCDQLLQITTTTDIMSLEQNVYCQSCKWCPKLDGFERPDYRKSIYSKKIHPYFANS